MQETYTEQGLEARLHAGRQEDRIHVTLVVTNNGDEEFTASSGMGTWSYIHLVDENDVPRLQGVGSTAAVTPWAIPPNKSLVAARVTETPAEASEAWDMNFDSMTFITDIDEYLDRSEEDDDVFFANNVNLPEENHIQLTATGSVDLGAFNPELQIEFTPTDLDEPLDPEEFDIPDSPRRTSYSTF